MRGREVELLGQRVPEGATTVDDHDPLPGGRDDPAEGTDHLVPVGEVDLLVGDYRATELDDYRSLVHTLTPPVGTSVTNASNPLFSIRAATALSSPFGATARTLPPPPAPVSFAPRHPDCRQRSTSRSRCSLDAPTIPRTAWL